jgi:hypothetical protein
MNNTNKNNNMSGINNRKSKKSALPKLYPYQEEVFAKYEEIKMGKIKIEKPIKSKLIRGKKIDAVFIDTDFDYGDNTDS